MKKTALRFIMLALMVGGLAVITGCDKKKSTSTGAVIGAGAGALTGGLIGKNAGSVIGGAVGGGLLGGLFGNAMGDDTKKGA